MERQSPIDNLADPAKSFVSALGFYLVARERFPGVSGWLETLQPTDDMKDVATKALIGGGFGLYQDFVRQWTMKPDNIPFIQMLSLLIAKGIYIGTTDNGLICIGIVDEESTKPNGGGNILHERLDAYMASLVQEYHQECLQPTNEALTRLLEEANRVYEGQGSGVRLFQLAKEFSAKLRECKMPPLEHMWPIIYNRILSGPAPGLLTMIFENRFTAKTSS